MGGKLGRHAARNWCLLCLLPVMIGDRIKHPLGDDVWQLCLKLRKVVDLKCVPENHTVPTKLHVLRCLLSSTLK